MKKSILSKTLLTLVLIPANGLMYAQAQSGRYNGPPTDFERVRHEPPAFNECTNPSEKSVRELAACNFGAEEARRIAMKYGGGHGRIQGFLRGFSWGLHSMAETISRDPWAINQGERAVDSMDYYITSATQLGRQQGESQGRIAGTKLAVDRFVASVDTGKYPSSQFVLPPAPYTGEDNGYERFVDKNGAKSPRQILRDELGHMNSHLKAYDNADRVFIGDIPHLSLWDAWQEDGIHRVDARPWFDEDAALQIWLSKSLDGRIRYNSLNDPPRKEVATGKDEKTGPARPKEERTVDYQKVFRSAFTKAYKKQVRYYFSREFYPALDEGHIQGELVGTDLGRKIAYQKGMIEAFNAKFKANSQRAFQSAYESTCLESFRTAFYDHADNAKLNIDFIQVTGMEDDGIIQPGETIAVSFKITNSGGQAASIRASMTGDVIDPKMPTLGNMPALATKVFKTPAIAVINPQLHTGMNANLLLKVNGIDVPHTEKILTPIQIAGYKNVLETTAGTARIFITVQNISTLRSPGEVKVSLILPEKSQEKVLGLVDAGQFKETEITLTGMDPFALIKGIDTEIQVSMKSRLMSDNRSKLIPADVKLELASYFDQLIKGRGLVPVNLQAEDRILSVNKMIIEKNLADVNADTNDNPWKEHSLSTMLGLLVHNLRSTSQTAATKKIYAQLGKDLWQHRQELGKVLFFKSGKRKEYELLCKELMQK
jgi:hypothetical protein